MMPSHNKNNEPKGSSLRIFLRNQLLILTGFIVASFAALILYIYVDGLDIATQKGLMAMGAYYGQLHEEGELKRNSVEAKEWSIYVGRENLPSWITQRFPQEVFENYALVKNFRSPDDLPKELGRFPVVLMSALPIDNGARQLFAVYHFGHEGQDLATPPNIIFTVLSFTFGIFLLLMIATLIIARRFNTRVLKPMEALANMAAGVDKGLPDTNHPVLKDNSEVGQVAQALKQGMERIHEFHRREKDFLENASHELRTPITVVGTALDIIDRRQLAGKTDMQKPLLHIRQAANNMQETTEALLWLSKASGSQAPNDADDKNVHESSDMGSSAFESSVPESIMTNPQEIHKLLNDVVGQLNYLIEGRDVKVIITVQAPDVTIQEPALFRIITSNLIRNAFEHTFNGEVNIHLSHTGITILDTGIGLQTSHDNLQRGQSGRHSFGLGLDIVRRISHIKSWTLLLKANPEGGCIAKLNW